MELERQGQYKLLAEQLHAKQLLVYEKSHKSVHEPLYWDSQMESINIGEKFDMCHIICSIDYAYAAYGMLHSAY